MRVGRVAQFQVAIDGQRARIPRMILPQYTTRSVLIGVSLAAVYCFCVSWAMRGSGLAGVVAVAGAAVVLSFLVQAALFLVLRGVAAVWPRTRSERGPKEPA